MKFGGMLGRSVAAANQINKAQKSEAKPRKWNKPSNLDVAVPPAELFSAFNMPANVQRSFTTIPMVSEPGKKTES
jgi:hypothetical protein